MDYLTTDTELKAVADAIRAQTGGSQPITYPSGFVTEIASIDGGEYESADDKQY
jgi:hypothetical protein